MSAAPTPAPTKTAGPALYLIAGIFLVLVLVALYVYMHRTGDGEGFVGISTMLAPIVAGLFAKAAVDTASSQQNLVLNSIHHNTNGVLEGKIRAGVRDVLADRDAAITSATALAQAAPFLSASTATPAPATPAPAALDPATFTPEPAPDFDVLTDDEAAAMAQELHDVDALDTAPADVAGALTTPAV